MCRKREAAIIISWRFDSAKRLSTLRRRIISTIIGRFWKWVIVVRRKRIPKLTTMYFDCSTEPVIYISIKLSSQGTSNPHGGHLGPMSAVRQLSGSQASLNVSQSRSLHRRVLWFFQYWQYVERKTKYVRKRFWVNCSDEEKNYKLI